MPLRLQVVATTLPTIRRRTTYDGRPSITHPPVNSYRSKGDVSPGHFSNCGERQQPGLSPTASLPSILFASTPLSRLPLRSNIESLVPYAF
mmetsp:Transcript_35182/g.63308  ORF Transcript_35182/g.63308 Transcript_35182/m.63308 type:complete len:91 (-) Transcript_35182:342-614(-)